VNSDDTIFAPASGHGRAAIAVIRMSGPGTRGAVEALAGAVPPPRRMALRNLRNPASGDVLDQALVLWMPGPESFTGEDQAELHIHGGLAVRSAVLRALSMMPGCRAAEPGEFTRRAFLNGRMDLSSVEGLADLIDAETEAQRRQALRQLAGTLGELVDGWRDRLIEILALLEASLDFSDERDVEDAAVDPRIPGMVAALAEEMGRHLADERRGERLREGFAVVLAGPPNAGKSTLLNALARREVAIVSEIPGTTRDAIEVHCDLAGLPVTFIDTAGLRETEDPIERLGVARTRAHAAEADLVLWLVPPEGGADVRRDELGSAPALRLGTKSDLPGGPAEVDLRVSALTGAGLSELLDRIGKIAEGSLGQGDAVITRERHRQAFEEAHESLRRASTALEEGHSELAAEDVRLALRALGRITGRVDVEEILDRLFATFCIGK
jgi:tRNA modification GTPase